MAGPANILIVDDDDDLREALAILLKSEGHRVIEAANGQLALDALASVPTFDLIILDLMMPVMDGATFLEHKARSAHADVPVVIHSSSPFNGLERFASVTSKVPKVDGIERLLGAIQCLEGNELAPEPLRRAV